LDEKTHTPLLNKASQRYVSLLANVPTPKPGGDHTMIGALLDRNEFRHHAQQLFEKTSNPDHLAGLMRALAEPRRAAPAQAAFPLLPEFLVLESLARATDGDAQRADAALKCLRSGAFLPAKGSTEPATQAALDALDAAGQLASSPDGFGALMSQMEHAPAADMQPHVRRLLEAAVQLKVDTGKPVDINRLPPAGESGTLAHRMLELQIAALKGKDMSDEALSDEEKTDIFSWRNNFRSEAPRSELYRVQKRLAKFVKYVGRAELKDKREKAIIRWNDPASWGQYLGAKLGDAGSLVQQGFGRLKSPLNILAQSGTMNASLMHAEDDAWDLDQATHTVIGELHQHLGKQIAGRIAQGEIKREDLCKPGAGLPKEVERAAILEYWTSLLATYRPLGCVIDAEGIEKVAENIGMKYKIDTKQRNVLEDKLSRWKGHELSLADLQQWVKDSKLPTSQVRAHDGAHAEIEETPCGQALSLALKVYEQTQRPIAMSSAGLRHFFLKFFAGHNLGNNFTVGNGGVAGLSTRPILGLIKQVSWVVATAMGVPVSVAPNVDIRATGGRYAFLKAGSTTDGFEFNFGTQKPRSASVAAGASLAVGVPLIKWLRAKLGVEAKEAREGVETIGVMVRAPRAPAPDAKKYDTLGAREVMQQFIDALFNIVDGHRGKRGIPGPKQVWGLLGPKFYASSLTVGEQRLFDYARSGSLAGQASAGFSGPPPVKGAHPITALGLDLRLMKELSTRKTERTQDTGDGPTRSSASDRRWTAASVNWSTGGGQQNVNAGSYSILALYSFLQSYLLKDAGPTATYRTVRDEDGGLSRYFTLRDIEERDPDNYLRFLDKRHDQMITLFKARFGEEDGPREYESFKAKVKNWSGPNQRHYIRYRITDQARENLQAYLAIAGAVEARQHNPGDQERALQQDRELQQIANLMHETLQDEASWVPTEVFTMEAQRGYRTKGINLGFVLETGDYYLSDREDAFIGTAPGIGNSWAQEGLMQQDPVTDHQSSSKDPESPWHGFSVPPSPNRNSTSGSSMTGYSKDEEDDLLNLLRGGPGGGGSPPRPGLSRYDETPPSTPFSLSSVQSTVSSTVSSPSVSFHSPASQLSLRGYESEDDDLQWARRNPESDFFYLLDQVPRESTSSPETAQKTVANIFARPQERTGQAFGLWPRQLALPASMFIVSDHGGGGDCLFHALEGRHLAPETLGDVRWQVAEVRRQRPDSQVGERANATQLAQGLVESFPGRKDEMLSRMNGRHSVPNAVYAAFQAIPGMYAGEEELAQWCVFRGRSVVVVDQTSGEIARFNEQGHREPIVCDAANWKDKFKEAFRGSDLALHKSERHWQRIESLRKV
jgi:hypothetical protein